MSAFQQLKSSPPVAFKPELKTSDSVALGNETLKHFVPSDPS
jgi:hypothetical protein